MKKIFRFSLFIALVFITMSTQAQLTIDAQIRPRAEFRNGFKTPMLDVWQPAFFIEQRSRLTTTYQEDKFKIRFSLQDVRIWGAVNQIYKTDPSLTAIFEAWGQYFINDNLSFKAGRMPLVYNGHRFMGNLDWASQARSHDVAMFKLDNEDSGIKLDIAIAYNQQGFEPIKIQGNFYPSVRNYKTMQYAWFNKEFDTGHLSLLVSNSGYQVQTDQTIPEPENKIANRQTYGLDFTKKGELVDFAVEAYYQSGTDFNEKSISAYMFSGAVTIQTDLTPITLAADYLSGTSIDDTDNKSFSPLYGTNHKFYGYMDYFYVGNPHGQNGAYSSGLIDIYLQTKFQLGERTSLKANLHQFLSPVKLVDLTDGNSPEISKSLGTEIDLVFIAKLDKAVTLNVGYSQMFATASMGQVKGNRGEYAAVSNWVWVMLNFKPKLLNLPINN